LNVGDDEGKRIPAIFYRTEAGGEPVREWLKGLTAEDRKRIGTDIKTVEFGWPVGMPVCKPLTNGTYEVRTPNEELLLPRSNKSKHERGLR
jgi:hypothetical protein